MSRIEIIIMTSNVIQNITHAIQGNNLDRIVELISNDTGLAINCLRLPKSGDSLLHIAARVANGSGILRYLIQHQNANLESANSDGKTPLHEAAQFNQADSVRVLLHHGANVNALKRADWTPLMLACTKKDSLDVINLLLENNTDVFFMNKDGWNCFHIACREGSVDIIQALISHATKKFSQQQVCDFMFSRSKNGRNPLHTAVMHGHYDICEILLDHARNTTTATTAQSQVVNETDKCGSIPAMEACRFGHTKILQLVHENGGRVRAQDVTNVNGMNCLHVAAEAGQSTIISFLHDTFGFDINLPNQINGLTALHYAVRENQVDAIRTLLDMGADVTMVDKKGWTCVDMSKHLKKKEAYEILTRFQNLGLHVEG